jgi:hypothetical protein
MTSWRDYPSGTRRQGNCFGYNLSRKDPMDSFTLAVLIGGGIVIGVLGLVLLLDKGRPPVPPAATGKAGKR